MHKKCSENMPVHIPKTYTQIFGKKAKYVHLVCTLWMLFIQAVKAKKFNSQFNPQVISYNFSTRLSKCI